MSMSMFVDDGSMTRISPGEYVEVQTQCIGWM